MATDTNETLCILLFILQVSHKYTKEIVMSLTFAFPRSASGWTMFVFGVLAFLLGLLGLIQPEATLGLLGLEVTEQAARASGDYTLMFVIASSMASFNMGVYYVLAAAIDWKPFFFWTVPFRMVTFTVFTITVLRGIAPSGFLGVGAWELVGALATGAALLYERRQASATPEN